MKDDHCAGLGWLAGYWGSVYRLPLSILLRPSFFLTQPLWMDEWMNGWMDACMGTTKLTILITFGFLAL
jgi:hypothetical protein